MAFVTLFNLDTICQFYSNTSPVLFTKLHLETIEWEKRRFFVYMAASAYHVISKEIKNHNLRQLNFRYSCCINSSQRQGSGIIISLRKSCIVISDTLLNSFLDVLFSLFAVILSGLHEKPRRRKDWVTEKKYIEEFVWRTFLTARTPVFVTFCCFLHLLLPPSQVT